MSLSNISSFLPGQLPSQRRGALSRKYLCPQQLFIPSTPHRPHATWPRGAAQGEHSPYGLLSPGVINSNPDSILTKQGQCASENAVVF